MTATPDTTKLPDMFAEVDVPSVTRVGTVRFPNPFLDIVPARAGNPKALKFDLKNITDADDDEETLERVVARAFRMLTDAGDKAISDKHPKGVTVRKVDNGDWTITFWVLDYKVEKKTKPAETPATTSEVTE